MEPAALIRDYLLLGLRFDRIESGYVDAFTGDPALRQTVLAEPAPDPTELVSQARRLIAALPDVPHRNGFDQQRADYVGAHLRALECAGRKFAGEEIGFVEEVPATSTCTSARVSRRHTGRRMPGSTRCWAGSGP